MWSGLSLPYVLSKLMVFSFHLLSLPVRHAFQLFLKVCGSGTDATSAYVFAPHFPHPSPLCYAQETAFLRLPLPLASSQEGLTGDWWAGGGEKPRYFFPATLPWDLCVSFMAPAPLPHAPMSHQTASHF